MAEQDRRIVIDGDAYELQDWDIETGSRWLYRLVRMMAPMAGAGDRPQHEILGAVLASFSEEQFLEFLHVCISHTLIVGRDERGAETIQPFSGEAKLSLRRRYHVALALCAAHGRRQYADFFEHLPALLKQFGLT